MILLQFFLLKIFSNTAAHVILGKLKVKTTLSKIPNPGTRTELQYLRGYPKHRYVQVAAPARYGPSCKSLINAN